MGLNIIIIVFTWNNPPAVQDNGIDGGGGDGLSRAISEKERHTGTANKFNFTVRSRLGFPHPQERHHPSRIKAQMQLLKRWEASRSDPPQSGPRPKIPRVLQVVDQFPCMPWSSHRYLLYLCKLWYCWTITCKSAAAAVSSMTVTYRKAVVARTNGKVSISTMTIGRR